MMARCKSSRGADVKNGMRYKLLSVDGDNFKFVCITDDGEETGDKIDMSLDEVVTTMRLTHAITYFSPRRRAQSTAACGS